MKIVLKQIILKTCNSRIGKLSLSLIELFLLFQLNMKFWADVLLYSNDHSTPDLSICYITYVLVHSFKTKNICIGFKTQIHLI